mmetsp:Transcript_4533/g.6536  ORF Transcript_4533/g.6536 Transcript_4533/m.6536 type:complete len:343 (-) Transcript_4533:135-1163(-)|eukprot:CAMPEP_0194200996 /NCGR_PEP_ID=MMETSP0156-20130528/1393_1 /TAXON_ID=33649 /ORGANISM="Thalassionema nitzschioides, Strain L26-B" /LENGTH=342 /DNA_ID=CAMNT_0038926081 /DNA_START=32 /DNA_END=1057 /DNA_ORIENTATION=-
MVSYQRCTSFEHGDAAKSIPIFAKDELCCLDGHSQFEILLGKEKSIFNHSGNKRFRAIISFNVHKYMAATTKSEKSRLVRVVHSDMQKSGFRVMKRDPQLGWRCINEADSREKLSHALRDRVREMKRPTRRQKNVSSEGIYPMIMSMAKALNENQKLLKRVMGPSPPMEMPEYSKAPTMNSSSGNGLYHENSFYVNSGNVAQPNNLIDMIGSMPAYEQGSSTLSNTLREEATTSKRRQIQESSLWNETFEVQQLPDHHRKPLRYTAAHAGGYCQAHEDHEPMPLNDGNTSMLASSLDDFSRTISSSQSTNTPGSLYPYHTNPQEDDDNLSQISYLSDEENLW